MKLDKECGDGAAPLTPRGQKATRCGLAGMATDERGTTAVIFALALTALMGAVALVIDVGTLYQNRSQLQNGADAAVLAGSVSLPDAPDSARSAAILYASRNNVTLGPGEVTISSTYDVNDTITVTPQRTVLYRFGRVLGLSSAPVSARARAVVGTLGGGTSMMPWGLVDNDPARGHFGFGYGTSIEIKLWEENVVEDGNFQALSVDGTGASEYRDSIVRGTDTKVSVGQTVDTEPGAMEGPTRQGIHDRIGTNNHAFPQVVQDNGDGTFNVINWQSPRIVMVPLIDSFARSGQRARITAFSIFFIEDWRTHGNELYVKGKFVNAVVPGGEWTPYQGSYGARAVHLGE